VIESKYDQNGNRRVEGATEIKVMAEELYLNFRQNARYGIIEDGIREKIRRLPSFVEEKSSREYWLKDENSESTWDFDVRIFFEKANVLIEVSNFTDAFSHDFKGLYEELASSNEVELVDGDSESYEW